MLRVGVALDSMETSAWIASAVERIQASSFARIELVLLGGTATEDRGGFLFRAYEAWDYKRYTWEQDALRRVSVAGALGGVPVAQWAERPDAGPPPGVRDLDVLVDFGAEEPVGPAWPEGPRLGTLRVQSELDFPGWKGRSGALATLQRTGTCASWVRLTGA